MGNCITYAPSTGTGLVAPRRCVTNPNEAITAHGYSSLVVPTTLNTANQSAVGSGRRRSPASRRRAFPIGRMVHYNNPIKANDRYFTGTLNAVLTGFTAPEHLAFDWRLDETPNTAAGTRNDEITFTNQVSDVDADPGWPDVQARPARLRADATATHRARPPRPPDNSRRTSSPRSRRTDPRLPLRHGRPAPLADRRQDRRRAGARRRRSTSRPRRRWPARRGPTARSPRRRRDQVTAVAHERRDRQRDRDRSRATTAGALTGLVCTQIGLNGQPEPVPGATSTSPPARRC